MKKKILVTGLAAAAVALSGTAFANNWLLYLPAILAGSGGGTEPPSATSSNNWLLYLPAILAASQGSEPPPVTETALNDTGIVDCSGVTGSADCAYGRDADVATNSNSDGHAGFSFTKLDSNGNALDANAASWVCVRDNVTGLTWVDKTSWTTTDWDAAQIEVSGFTACGVPSGDWRVPTFKELMSIVSLDTNLQYVGAPPVAVGSPSIDEGYFHLPAGYPLFWTADMSLYGTDKVWSIDFNLGLPFNIYERTSPLYVRFVSGTEQTEAFKDNGATVTDSNTKLTWKKCLEGQTWSDIDSTCTGTAALKTWSEALAAASGVWRLPNIKELQSIADYQNAQPVINGTFFPDIPSTSDVWSNSPVADPLDELAQDTLWYINFNGTDPSGYGEILYGTGPYHVRLVCEGDKDTCPL